MKKFLLLVIVILALFTVDHPVIKEPREALLGEGVSLLSEQSKVARSTSAKIARTKIMQYFELDDTELEYLNEALGTDDKLKSFHLRYCKEKDLNLYFYGDKLNEICRIASEAIFEGKSL